VWEKSRVRAFPGGSWACDESSADRRDDGLPVTLCFDHKAGSPESLLGLLPDINKPPLVLRSSKAVYISAWLDRRAGREEIEPKLLRACAPQNIEE